jgi:hypothetical protein
LYWFVLLAALTVQSADPIQDVPIQRKPSSDSGGTLLVDARAVFISNQSTDQKAFDELVGIIRGWGRWELVDSVKKAEIHAVFFDEAFVSPGTNVGFVPTAPGSVDPKRPSYNGRRALKLISLRDGRQLLVVKCKDLMSAGANAKAILGLLRMKIQRAEERSLSKP